MERPTREQVDEILEWCTPDEWFGDTSTLANEVRALREQLLAVQAFASAQDQLIGRLRDELDAANADLIEARNAD